MDLNGKKILLISPERWGKNKLSKHHYALHLAELGNEVTFLQPQSDKELEQPKERGIRVAEYIPFKGLSKLPALIAQKLLKKEWKKVIQLIGHEPDLIWSFDNSVLFDFSSISAVAIAHVVDLNQNFQFQPHAATADLCLGSTPYIAEKLLKYNRNAHFLQHGCVARTQEKSQEKELIGMYLGNLTIAYIDREFVKRLLLRFPDIQFVFLGSKGASNLSSSPDKSAQEFITWLETQPNVTLSGSIDQDQLDLHLRQAHFYFIAYAQEHHEQVANPHKVMELLSTGKPLFSFPIECYKTLGFPKTFSNGDDYLEGIAKAKEGNVPFENLNKEAQINYAEKHTYKEQIKRVESWLNKL